MTEQWQELKETIIELRDNNGTATQQEVCKFLANLMNVLEKQMQEPKTEKVIKMRDATPEEIELIDKYIKSISNPTGVDFWDLEQEPYEDAISRDMALEKMADYVASGYADSVEDFEEYSRIICQLPSVNPQPKTGHWSHDGSHWKNRFICSGCGYKLFDEPTNYCPNCGAKMVEPQESEDKE